jgi:hypothetical protein
VTLSCRCPECWNKEYCPTCGTQTLFEMVYISHACSCAYCGTQWEEPCPERLLVENRMTILEMITEWKKGCSCGGPAFDAMMKLPPGTTPCGQCVECTEGLINCIEARVRKNKKREIAKDVIIVIALIGLTWTAGTLYLT